LGGVEEVARRYAAVGVNILYTSASRFGFIFTDGAVGSYDLSVNVDLKNTDITKEQIEMFVLGLESLTKTEKAIYEAHLKRITTKEILELFNIKENTLKFHNKNIYGKLGVSSKKQLLEISKYI